jgi:hypothetical protein
MTLTGKVHMADEVATQEPLDKQDIFSNGTLGDRIGWYESAKFKDDVKVNSSRLGPDRAISSS